MLCCLRVRATAFVAVKDDLINAGAIWEDSETVVDKNIITAVRRRSR